VKSALDVHRELLAREVRHEMVRVRGRLHCADDLPALLDLREGCGAVRCFTVTAPADRGVAAVLVACGRDPDPDAVRAALGVDALRPSTADEVNAATDFAAGLVSPVGLPADVPLLVDAALASRHVLYTAAGEAGVALGIRVPDLLRATGATVAALTSTREIDLAGGDDRVVSLPGAEPAARRRT
jgi:Cys-tRNA(Pro)/Cys-tRNA(Cys) deacylase